MNRVLIKEKGTKRITFNSVNCHSELKTNRMNLGHPCKFLVSRKDCDFAWGDRGFINIITSLKLMKAQAAFTRQPLGF